MKSTGRRRSAPADIKTEKQRERNRRAYAKRGSSWSRLTDEQKAANLKRVREWKRKNKQRINSKGCIKHIEHVVKPQTTNPPRVGSPEWYDMLKAKHGSK